MGEEFSDLPERQLEPGSRYARIESIRKSATALIKNLRSMNSHATIHELTDLECGIVVKLGENGGKFKTEHSSLFSKEAIESLEAHEILSVSRSSDEFSLSFTLILTDVGWRAYNSILDYAREKVAMGLEHLSTEERGEVERGLRLFVAALEKARLPDSGQSRLRQIPPIPY